ncbi:hypothetical protein [Phaffia rhodozyma]|uniref:Uncharacterized protein n=1 Tax=Phaffia rhodozyma TaxID=264483 RepID=A0A0F7SQI7_PHARH|nr:hypothetical protein [Phaffia rhodozyma]
MLLAKHDLPWSVVVRMLEDSLHARVGRGKSRIKHTLIPEQHIWNFALDVGRKKQLLYNCLMSDGSVLGGISESRSRDRCDDRANDSPYASFIVCTKSLLSYEFSIVS